MPADTLTTSSRLKFFSIPPANFWWAGQQATLDDLELQEQNLSVGQFLWRNRNETTTLEANDFDEEISERLTLETIAPDSAVRLFADLVAAKTIEKRESLRSELLANASPDVILNVALSEYRLKGNEERLVFASSLLGEFGRDALKTIKTIVESGCAESEYFVSMIAHLAGISSSEKIELLAKLTTNENIDVRLCVVDALREIEPQSGTLSVWLLLAEDEDEEIRFQAEDELSID